MNANTAVRSIRTLLAEFGPAQLEQVRGLPETEIDRLEADIERRLCVGHRTLLAHFGATPHGAFRPALYDYKFDPETIRDYYRTHEGEPPQWVFFADTASRPQYEHLYAEHLDVEDPGIGTPILNRINQESLWNDLLHDMYVFLVKDSFEERGPSGWLWEGRKIPHDQAAAPFAEVEQLLARLGFEPWIPMANHQAIMRRKQSLVWFGRTGTHPEPDDWNLSLAGPDPRELREVWEILADNVGAVR